MCVSKKKKVLVNTDKSKGIELLSEVALLEDAQIKKALMKSKRDTNIHQVSRSNEGADFESERDSRDDKESDDVSDDDGNDDDSDNDDGDNNSDDVRTESDNDKNNDDQEEEYEEEYVRTHENYKSTNDKDEHVEEKDYECIKCINDELYKHLNVKLKFVEHGEEWKEDAEKIGPNNALLTNTEIISMMNVDVRHKEPSKQTPLLLTIPVTVIPETSTTATTTVPLSIPLITHLPQLSTPTPTPTTEATKTSVPDGLDISFSQIRAMVDAHLGTRLVNFIQKAFRSYTTKFKIKTQAERKRYTDLIEKSVKDIINDEVKTQLPQIMPKAVFDFATPVIKSTITESPKDVVLAKSSSQPQSTYEAVESLTEFELKKILIDKMEKSQSNLIANVHKEIYKALVNSYNVQKDLFKVYGKDVSLKRGREAKDKDEEPPDGSYQGMKRRNKSKDAEPSTCLKLKESRSNTEMPQNQGSDLGNTDEQPNVKAAPKLDWFMKHKRPSTLDLDCRVELEYNFEECYKALTNQLDWNNPKGKEYPFDLSKTLPLIMVQDHQVVPIDYFINNDLENLRGGSSSKKSTTSKTKTKASKYDIPGIKDMVPSLWSPIKVAYDRYVVFRISH
nr:hypothetical protein [Tanacetum cinerariifolium]